MYQLPGTIQVYNVYTCTTRDFQIRICHFEKKKNTAKQEFSVVSPPNFTPYKVKAATPNEKEEPQMYYLKVKNCVFTFCEKVVTK